MQFQIVILDRIHPHISIMLCKLSQIWSIYTSFCNQVLHYSHTSRVLCKHQKPAVLWNDISRKIWSLAILPPPQRYDPAYATVHGDGRFGAGDKQRFQMILWSMALNVLWNNASNVGGIASIDLPFSFGHSLTSLHELERSYIIITKRWSTGITCCNVSRFGAIVTFVKAFVTSSNACHAAQAVFLPFPASLVTACKRMEKGRDFAFCLPK